MKKAVFFIEYIVFRFVAGINNLMPLRVSYRISETIGPFLFKVLPKRRRIVMENLRRAFGGEKSEEELIRIAKASFVNMVDVAIEFVRIPKIRGDVNKYLELELQGARHVNEAFEKKRGAIALVSHFANWELLAFCAFMAHWRLFSIARPMKNPFVYRYIVRLRKMMHGGVIAKEGAVRQSIRRLRENSLVGMLIDQHESRGIWVDFFGAPACTSSLPAMLAVRDDIPVLPVFFYRNKNKRGRSVIHFYPPLPTLKTGDRNRDIFLNTQAYVKRIEEEIRKRPEDWLWMHRRWRKPPEEILNRKQEILERKAD